METEAEGGEPDPVQRSQDRAVHRSRIARRGTYGTTVTRFLSFRIYASERYELSPLILAGSWSGLPESGRSRKVFVFAWLCVKTQQWYQSLRL